MSTPRSIRSRILNSVRRSAGTDRGWSSVTDRDTDRTSFDVMIQTQLQHNNR